MGIIKVCFLFGIFGLAIYLGNAIARKYVDRVKELIAIKSALNILENKIKFTQTPLAEIFEQIEKSVSEKNIKKLFKNITHEKQKNIHESWENAINKAEINLEKEDKKILIDMGKILGSTDVDGQISNIKITSSFIDKQIQKAEEEKNKNVKLYKTLGIVSGLTIVIILI